MKPTRNLILSSLLAVFCGGLAGVVQAGTVTDQFNSGVDFLVNGVPNTIWDGVYLNLGDVPNGVGDGGDGQGATSEADETTFAGFLTVQSSGTSWNSTGDDGFYLWKVVSGDFDMSVTVVNPFVNGNYHMPGLLARAFTTNGPAWGAPFATSNGTNGPAENSLQITRFNEFSEGDIVRLITNGADIDQAGNGANGFAAPFNTGSTNYNTETNDNRQFRITRVGDLFSLYDRTNDADAWVLEATNNRTDLDGIPMQVGIADSAFFSSQYTTYYTNFVLSGPNVGTAGAPPANATGLSAAVTSSSQVTFSWTPGAGSAGSILVIRKNSSLVTADKPINGYTYNANTNFPGGDNLGGNISVVYAGSGSSAVITGLGSVVDSIYAAVYSYSGSGSSIVYGVTPATTVATGSEPVTNLVLNLLPNSIPLNGVSQPQVIVTYGDGSTTVNPSGVVLASTNLAVATIFGGVVDGVALGVSQITATYGGQTATNFVTVNSPAFADNFNVSANYLTNGLLGSAWEGLYENQGDLPNGTYAGAPVQTTVFDANVTSNGVLTLRAANSYWAGGADNGPFLFKYVPGDFEASVHIHSISRGTNGLANVGFMFDGLMARAADNLNLAQPSDTPPTGAPFNGSENWVYWGEFEEFGDATEARFAVNGGDNENPVFSGSATSDYWLLMQRSQGTNFYFYRKINATDPWEPRPEVTIVRPTFTNGMPLQVGLFQATYSGNAGTVQFDSFSLDAANISGGTPPSAPYGLTMSYDPTGNSITLTWVAGTNADGSAATSFVIMRQGAPVSSQPYFGILTGASTVFGQGSDLGGGNYLVFRGGGLGTNTVTVTGLTAGQNYFAAVYCYSGGGATKSFNEAGSSAAFIQAGIFTGITASLNSTIPLGGIGLPVVTGILQGGNQANVSSSAVLISGDTNVIVTANGVLTGVAIGSATNTVEFTSGTNTFTTNLVATVRAPTFTDNFSVNHDYHANGVTNTPWDGVYVYPGFKVPDATFVSSGLADVSAADANITSNGVLTVTSENVGWENAQDDGFFLFKYAPADFQIAVHVTTPLLDTNGAVIAAFNYPGLLARPYIVDTNGNVGAPISTNGDYWVSWARFDEFGIGTRAELIRNNATTAQPSADVGDGQLWLLMLRQNGTNFYFFQRANATDPWRRGPAGQTFSTVAFAGRPMQVGIEEGGFDSGGVVIGQFDSFMADLTASPVALTATPFGGNIVVSWPAYSSFNYTLLSSSSLTPANWQPVAGTPAFNNGVGMMTIPETNSATFFRLQIP